MRHLKGRQTRDSKYTAIGNAKYVSTFLVLNEWRRRWVGYNPHLSLEAIWHDDVKATNAWPTSTAATQNAEEEEKVLR
jgi:hypothetical protein